jgi:hypothetical protein
MPLPGVRVRASGDPWPPPPAAGSATPWQRFTFPAAALIDTGGLLDPGSQWDDATGRLRCVFDAAHATAVDGYREALARYTVPVLEVDPDFDPSTQVIDLGIDLSSFNHAATGACGVFFGIVDSTTVDANLMGQCLAVRTVSAAADLVGRMDNDNIPGFDQGELRQFAMATFSIGFNGTDYPLSCAVLAVEEGQTDWTPLVSGQGEALRDQIEDWQFVFGGMHGSTVVIPSVTQVVTLWYRIRDFERDFPAVAMGAKPSSGEFNIVVVGDSIADGIGADPTGDGSDLLAYGGSAVPAGGEVIDEGVAQANYQDNAGVGPEPGILPHLIRLGLADGFTTVRVFRCSVSGQATTTIRNGSLQAAIDDVGRAEIPSTDVHLVVLLAATNDSQAGESVAFAATAPKIRDDIRHAFPNARLVWVGPGAADGVGFEDANEVRAIIAALDDVLYFDATAAALHDSSHPSLAGYRTIGEGVWALWGASP